VENGVICHTLVPKMPDLRDKFRRKTKKRKKKGRLRSIRLLKQRIAQMQMQIKEWKMDDLQVRVLQKLIQKKKLDSLSQNTAVS
jgi:hypothetical protein